MATLGQWVRSKLTPPSLEEVEAETRKWTIRCTSCGRSQNLWDAGGTRYKALRDRTVLGRCAGCGDRLRSMTIFRHSA